MTRPGRRGLLATLATMPLAAVPAIAGEPSAEAEAEVIALCARVERLERRLIALGDSHVADDDLFSEMAHAIFAEQDAPIRRLCEIESSSPAAIMAKLRLLAILTPERAQVPPDARGHTRPLLASALRDALRTG